MGSPCKCHRKGCSLSLGFTAQLHILYFSKPISINLSGIDLAVKKKRKDNHKNKYTAAGAHEDKMAHINN